MAGYLIDGTVWVAVVVVSGSLRKYVPKSKVCIIGPIRLKSESDDYDSVSGRCLSTDDYYLANRFPELTEDEIHELYRSDEGKRFRDTYYKIDGNNHCYFDPYFLEPF